MDNAIVPGFQYLRVELTGAVCRSALLLCLMSAGCAWTGSTSFAPPDYQVTREEWDDRGVHGTHVTTDHFDVFTSMSDAEFVAYLPGFLETAHTFYASLLPVPTDGTEDPARMQTYILATRGEWDSFVKRRYGKRYNTYRMISAGGFSEGNACVLYDIGRAATLSVIAHEGMHQYAANYFSGPLPAWLNEGLATYCETVEFRKDVPHFTPQRNTFRINHLRDAMSLGSTLELGELLATNAGAVISANRLNATATYYAQAWGLVVYLRHGAGAEYAEGFERMLGDIANGTLRIKAQAAKATAPIPSETSYGESVFYAYFTDDITEFERGYYEFLKHLCWK